MSVESSQTAQLGLEIVKTVGSVITFAAGVAVTLIVERLRTGEQRRTEARQLHRARKVAPIEAFVDEQLDMISEAYWISTESIIASAKNDQEAKEMAAKEASTAVADKLKRIRNREGSVAARVRALKDTELSEAFRKLSTQLANMHAAGVKGGFGAAREEHDKAVQLGAEVLEALWRDRRSEP